jgi:hypothetical protein
MITHPFLFFASYVVIPTVVLGPAKINNRLVLLVFLLMMASLISIG